MKKTKFMGIMLALVIAGSSFAACGSTGDSTADGASAGESGSSGSSKITVISREEGSGTRGAFVELTGVEEKDADGNKSDKTTTEALVCKSTDVVLTQVAGDKNAIGYISLGSMNDTVKAVKIDDTEPTVENVENNSYKIVRPFNIIVKKDKLSKAAQDFENFILSKEGQEVIGEKYIQVDKAAEAFKSNGATGKVVVAGSSSVTPIMEKLKEAYEKVNSGVTVEVQQSDLSTGIKSAIDETCDIGMASRDLKENETGVESVKIASDAIAVVVNKDNSNADSLSVDQIKSIYTGETTDWSQLAK